MKCSNHPKRDAEHFCSSCGIPLCQDCIEESGSGGVYCFQCAMLHSVSQVGSSIETKKDLAAKKKLEKKKPWGPFQYFVIVASSLIVVMWGVILFGGSKPPESSVDFANNRRVFLFLVDSAVKRYTHYEGNRYPDNLTDIVPGYLALSEEDMIHLNMLSYRKDPVMGYVLSFSNVKPGEMNILITAKGIKHEANTNR